MGALDCEETGHTVWPIVVGVGGIAVVGGAIAASVVHKGRLDDFDAKLCGKAGASPDCPKIGKAAPLKMSCGVGADGTGAGMSCVGAF